MVHLDAEIDPTVEVSLISTALAITAQVGGVSILPAHLLPAKQFPSLVAVPLTAPQLSRQVSLVTRAGVSLSPAARRFVAIAKANVATRWRGFWLIRATSGSMEMKRIGKIGKVFSLVAELTLTIVGMKSAPLARSLKRLERVKGIEPSHSAWKS